MIKGIEHIAVASADTFALKSWYEKVFGFKTVYDNGKGTYFVAADDGSMIEIIKAEDCKEQPALADSGIRHFALSVDEKGFDEAVTAVRAENVEIISEPSVSSKGIKTFFFRDIDGNIFHLIYRPVPLI